MPTEKQVAYLSHRFREMRKWFSEVSREGQSGNYIYVELENFVRTLNRYEITSLVSMLDKEEYGSIKEMMQSKGFKHFV